MRYEVALPVSLPLSRHRMRQRRVDRHQILLAIRDAAVVLAPSHFGGVGAEIHAGNAMMNTDLSAADAQRTTRLGLCRPRRPNTPIHD